MAQETEQELTSKIERLRERVAELRKRKAHKHKAQQKARVAEDFLRSLVDAMRDGVCVLDAHGIHVGVNDAFCEMTEFSREELIGVGPPHPYWPPEECKEIEKAFQKTLRGEFDNFELTFKRKSGDRFPVMVSPSWIKDECGNVVSCFATVRDITERKRLEQALRGAEERYRTQFEEAIDAIFVADVNTGITIDCNAAAARLVDREKSEIIGQHQRILHPPEAIEGEFSRTFKQHVAEKRGQVLETQVITRDGQTKDVAIKANVFEAGGKEIVQGIFRDITEQKKADEKLKEANEIINRSATVAFTWRNSEGWPVEFASENVKKIFGYTAEEFVSGKVLYEKCVHPDDLERVAREVDTYSKEEGREEFVHEPYRIVTKEGEVRVISDWTFIVRDPERKITHYKGIVEDITGQKKAEEKIRRAAEEWRTTFDAIPDMVFVLDKDFTILRANKAVADALKCEPQEVIGKKCYEVLHKSDRPWHSCPFKVVLKEKRPHVEEVDDPNIGIPLSVTCSPVLDERGQVVGGVHMARDISEMKKVEKERMKRMHELEVFQKAAVDRELRMAQLKKSVAELEKRVAESAEQRIVDAE